MIKKLLPMTFGGSPNNYYNETIRRLFTNSRVSKGHTPIWNHLRDHECHRILEIGLGDALNVKTMLKLASDDCKYFSFDLGEVNYLVFQFERDDRDKITEHLKSEGNAVFYVGDSKETLPACVHTLPMMDLIIMDGGFDYDTVKSDWNNCKKLMHLGTVCFIRRMGAPSIDRVVSEIRNGYTCERCSAGWWKVKVRKEGD